MKKFLMAFMVGDSRWQVDRGRSRSRRRNLRGVEKTHRAVYVAPERRLSKYPREARHTLRRREYRGTKHRSQRSKRISDACQERKRRRRICTWQGQGGRAAEERKFGGWRKRKRRGSRAQERQVHRSQSVGKRWPCARHSGLVRVVSS